MTIIHKMYLTYNIGIKNKVIRIYTYDKQIDHFFCKFILRIQLVAGGVPRGLTNGLLLTELSWIKMKCIVSLIVVIIAQFESRVIPNPFTSSMALGHPALVRRQRSPSAIASMLLRMSPKAMGSDVAAPLRCDAGAYVSKNTGGPSCASQISKENALLSTLRRSSLLFG
jgi:hypothetical protein